MIVYSNYDEVLVCREEDEQILLDDYFTNGCRNTEDYDRQLVTDKVVEIVSRIHT